MRTLALDATGDLMLSGGRPVLVSGADAVAQRLRTRLGLFQGEWLLDRQVGFPWRRILGEKGVDRLAEVLLRAAISSCPGVKAITAFTFTFNRTTRRASVTFTVTTIAGEPVTIADFTPGAV